jgi:hypothetical protein
MRSKKTAIVIATVLLLTTFVTFQFVVPMINIGLAYKGKMLCSGIFISKRSPESVLSIDIAADNIELMNKFDSHVDYNNQTVVVDAFGFLEQTFQYRPGLGCTQFYQDYPLRTDLKRLARPVEKHSVLEVQDRPGPAMLAVLDWAFTETDESRLKRTRAIVVLHRGKIVAERYAPGITKDTALQGWSLAKSVINALVGILVKQGRLQVDAPALVPEWQTAGDPRTAITLDQLMHMETGLAFDEQPGDPLNDVSRMLFASPDVYAFATAKQLQARPGTSWAYTSGTTNIVSGILRRVIGEPDYLAFPRHELFNPLGMSGAVLEPDAAGTFVGSSFIYATARDWARFGQLYVQDGVWRGERLLPEGWVAYSCSPARQSPDQRYAAHFWLSVASDFDSPTKDKLLPSDTFHAIGRSGQFVTIIPSREIVIVRLGLTKQKGAWQHDIFVNKVLHAIE